mgnify:CR=1 FL=1
MYIGRPFVTDSKASLFATTGVQANFVRQPKTGTVISNGHLNVTQ